MSAKTASQEPVSASLGLRRGLHLLPLRVLGFGLYWTWLWVLTFTSLLFTPSTHSLIELTALRATGFVTQAVTLLLTSGFANQLLRRLGSRVISVGVALLGVVATVCATVGYRTPGNAGLWVALAGWILWGFSGACLTLLWSGFYCSTDTKSASTYLPASVAFGAILCFSVIQMQPGAAFAVVVCLPVASVIMLALALAGAGEVEGEQPAIRRGSLKGGLSRLLVGIAVYALVSGFLIASTISQPGRGFDGADRLTLLGPAVLGLTIALIVALSSGLRNLATLYEFILPTMVAGFLLLPFIGARGEALATWVVLAGYLAFDILSSLVLLHEAHRVGLSPVKVLLFGRTANVVGHAGGWTVALLTVARAPLHVSAFTAASLIAAFVLVLTTALTLKERDLFFTPQQDRARAWGDEAGTADSASGRWRQRCLEISQEHHLSPREEEVLVLLAKGRDASHIQNALVISRHTVEAHTYHIYRKLNIHSRQELLDLIEADSGAGVKCGGRKEASLD